MDHVHPLLGQFSHIFLVVRYRCAELLLAALAHVQQQGNDADSFRQQPDQLFQ